MKVVRGVDDTYGDDTTYVPNVKRERHCDTFCRNWYDHAMYEKEDDDADDMKGDPTNESWT